MRCVSYFARDVDAGTAWFMMNDEWAITGVFDVCYWSFVIYYKF